MEIHCILCDDKGKFWQDLAKICVMKCGHIAHLHCVENTIGINATFIMCPSVLCKKKTRSSEVIKIDVAMVERQMQTWRTNEPTKCNLCYEFISLQDEVGVTKCGHIQHLKCLLALIGIKNKKGEGQQKSEMNTCSCCANILTRASVIKLRPVLTRGDDVQHATTTAAAILRELGDTLSTNNEVKSEAESSHNSDSGSRRSSECDNSRSEAENQPPYEDTSTLPKQEIQNVCSTGNDDEDINVFRERCKNMEDQIIRLQQERDHARNESEIWQVCYKYFEDKVNETDILKQIEQIPKMLEENKRFTTHVQDLESQLKAAKQDKESAETLRADFEMYIEENLNLKNENEELKKDLEAIKVSLAEFDANSTELVQSLTEENETINKLNESLLEENVALKQNNETLQRENRTITEIVNALQEKQDHQWGVIGRRQWRAGSSDQETPNKKRRPSDIS